MNMLRHYFVSDSLDDLEVFEQQLEAAGVSAPQIHVLSRNNAGVANHRHLHEVQSFMTRDIVHSAQRGAVVGLFACVLALYVAYHAGWTDTAAGWMSFIFHVGGRIAQNGKTQPQLRPIRTGFERRQACLFCGSRAPAGSGSDERAAISPAGGVGRNGIVRAPLAYCFSAKSGDGSTFVSSVKDLLY